MKNISINNQIVCHYCKQDGHIKNRCAVKRNVYYGMKCVWFSKRTIANSQEPETVGVPET